MATSLARRPILSWLYNHNPFYVISSALMLYAVRTAYGELEVGEINCRIMLGVLAAYTSILAGVSVLIVRWGTVWEDARSLLLLLLLLFLAVSVSADDLFVNMESSTGGTLLMLGGYLFAATVTELVLRGTGLRLGWKYRLPLHLLLLLFYVTPWWCSPELHQRSARELEWTIFAFPVIASALLLGLLPAIRSGPDYANDNGSPWRWPWYPWPAFVIIGIAVAFRSFALSMTFGPTGPIWIELASGGRQIAFDTAWGTYFLIPLVLAMLILILEAGFVTGNQKTIQQALKAAPVLLILALPFSDGEVFRGFLRQFAETLGSPLWLTVWTLSGFYLLAWLRGAADAEKGFLFLFSLLSIVGPQSVDLRTLTPLEPWPLLMVGGILLGQGVWTRSSQRCLGGSVMLVLALWLWLPVTLLAVWRMTICFHLLWGTVILLGLTFRDRTAETLRIAGAVLMPLTSMIVMTHPAVAVVPIEWRITYLILLTVICVGIAMTSRNMWYWYAFLTVIACSVYELAAVVFRDLASLIGQAALTAIAWSTASLLIAFLISAHKARWLPRRIFPLWKNHPPSESDMLPTATEAPVSPDQSTPPETTSR
ncbi:MAG TPA: hypothetical protein VNQ76_18870 [Planctomicrobium sp.]|nr:hypothetical protein [Planctomicrobium sp.]